MSTRTVTHGLIAFVLLVVAATPAVAQEGTAYKPGVVVGAHAGGGSLQLDCDQCGDWQGAGAAVLEWEAGVDVTPHVRLLLVRGAGAAEAGDLSTDISWTLAGLRFKPAHGTGLFLQGLVGQASGTLTREKPPGPVCAQGDVACAVIVYGLFFGLPALLNGPTYETFPSGDAR